jgi:hypothetical protein
MLIVAILMLAAAASTRPVWGEARGQQGQAPVPPQIYDVRVVLDEISTGTTTFIVDSAGKVSGTMHLDDPNLVDATLAGAVKDGVWTFEYGFSMSAQNCTGTATGTAKVSGDRSTVAGSVTVTGGCTSQPQSGTFTFTKRAK